MRRSRRRCCGAPELIGEACGAPARACRRREPYWPIRCRRPQGNDHAAQDGELRECRNEGDVVMPTDLLGPFSPSNRAPPGPASDGTIGCGTSGPTACEGLMPASSRWPYRKETTRWRSRACELRSPFGLQIAGQRTPWISHRSLTLIGERQRRHQPHGSGPVVREISTYHRPLGWTGGGDLD